MRGASASRHLPSDVIKREVSSSFSMVAAWLRSGRLADQNNSSSSPSSPSPIMDGWALGNPQDIPAAIFHRTVLPRVSLVTEPHLHEPPARLLWSVGLGPFLPSFQRSFSQTAFPPFAHAALVFLLCFGWKCRERTMTFQRRALIGRSRATSL